MARKKRKRNASRGSVNNIILKTLVTGDKYGYEIIKEVEEFSDGKIQLKQPSLYSSLSRFEEKQFVTSYWGDSDIGGRRHYYHLTELGLNYYKKHVLKEDDIEDEDEEEEVIESTSQQEVKEDISELFIPNKKPEETQPIIEVKEDLNEDEQTISIKINPDYLILDDNKEDTTVNTNIKECDKAKDEVYNRSEIVTVSENNETPWKALADSTKKSNKSFSETNSNRLFIKKPKKEQRIIKDTDGIYKLRDDDYIPPKKQSQPVIIDNVIKRSKSNTIFGYTTYTSEENLNKNESRQYTELTEEEKLKRNENFLAKFNLLTKSKMKPVSTPAPKPIEEKVEKQIDYRGKLDAIYANSFKEEIIEKETPEQNNLFNYVEDENWQTEYTPIETNELEEDPDDKFIDFEPIEEFDVKQDNQQYIEKINTFTASYNKVNMSRYENTTQAVLIDKTYILHNKLKLVFGIIMSLFMIAEITFSWFYLTKLEYVYEQDKYLFLGSYFIIGIFLLITTLPYLSNPHLHKANTFKLRYMFWFGVLTFLVCTVLIYCVNALFGFELDNFSFYVAKIVVPLILTSNFIIAPIFYAFLSKCKKFYD